VSDIWELCQQTFGRIEARWRQPLEAMDRHHTPAQLERAFNEAAEYKARDLGYVESILERLRAEQTSEPSEPTIPDRLLCDLCGLPSWTNAMVVRGPKGLCERCAAEAPKEADLPRHLGPAWLYPELPSIDALLSEETALLMRWYAVAEPPKLAARIEHVLVERRAVAPAELPRRAVAYTLGADAAPTPTARLVAAYWARVGVGAAGAS